MKKYSQFAESLKRLFEHGKLAIFKLEELRSEEKITEEEFNYITNK